MSRVVYEYKINSIIDHTHTIRELHLELTNHPEFNFKAGQFVMLHVPVPDGGKALLRAYSIASTDQDNKRFSLLFKSVETGKATEYVWALKGDEILKFTGPFGKVFFQEPPTEQIVFLNTGSGLSQHMSFLLSKMNQYPNLKYKLYFGIRSEKDIYFQKELDELKSKSTDLIKEKTSNEEQIVNTIIEEFSISIALKLASENSLQELIDSEIYTLLSQHSKDKVLKLKEVIPSSTRVCIYPKDVQRIMGKEYAQARLYLLKIKKHFNKEQHQLISIEEFCEYTGLKIEHVVRCIVG